MITVYLPTGSLPKLNSPSISVVEPIWGSESAMIRLAPKRGIWESLSTTTPLMLCDDSWASVVSTIIKVKTTINIQIIIFILTNFGSLSSTSKNWKGRKWFIIILIIGLDLRK